MDNKDQEINKLLSKIENESLPEFKIVDFWDSDMTAIGIQVGNNLIYVSTFNYDKTGKYNVIIEEYNTGKLIKGEKENSYTDLIRIIQNT